jgi:hypothetical protein
MGSTATDENVSSPIKLSIDYPENLSKGTLLLRAFFGWAYVGIPHGIILALYSIASIVVTAIAWWGILLYGRYPRNMFDFVIKLWRWSVRVNAYMNFFTDQYPAFNGDEDDSYPARISVEYPESLSRGTLILKTLFGWAYVGIPHGFMLWLYGIAFGFVQFVAWWAVLFTSVYPRSFFDFNVAYFRWSCRVGAYTWLLTDVYPPFSGAE